ncbi:uncharacterized protein LOC143045238 [Mytilus galloprovincialis]|uniref:uncharacterized protein LOC143045238 n=1 Tax=Mytilus galloprovincialis TaxID=29158 RepID=UPI003F7BB1E3
MDKDQHHNSLEPAKGENSLEPAKGENSLEPAKGENSIEPANEEQESEVPEEGISQTDITSDKNTSIISTLNQKDGKYQCTVCQKFFLKHTIRRHIKNFHADGKTHVCRICLAVFSQKYDLIIHTKTAHARPPKYKCNICDKTYMHKNSLIRHKECHSDTEFLCNICNKNFKSSDSLKKHCSSHGKEKKYICSVCGNKFMEKHYLKIHMASHSNDKLRECTVCNRKFSTIAQCKTHEEKVHAGNITFTCPVCNKFYFESYQLKNHMKKHSVAEKKPGYKCGTCGKSITTRWSLKKHELRHLGVEKIRCDICDKGFSDNYTLKKHKKLIHTLNFDFKCQICGQGFVCKEKYKHHQARHLKIRKHQCNFCKRKFLLERSCISHMKIKHQDEYFAGRKSSLHECEFCGKKFLYLKLRNEHIKLHTGHRPLICQFCNKSYRTQQTLALHEKRHTNPFECGICHAQFIQKHLLLKHLKKHEDTTTKDHQEQQNINVKEQTQFVHDNLLKIEANNSHDSMYMVHSAGAVDEQSQFGINSQLSKENHTSKELRCSNDVLQLQGGIQQACETPLALWTEGLNIEAVNDEIKPEIINEIKEEVKTIEPETNDHQMKEQSTFLNHGQRSDTEYLSTCSSGFPLKTEHTLQQNIVNPLNGNVVTMTKLGSVKVNTEDLQKILNRGNILDIIKSQTPNDL